ncbi:putative proline-rich protein 24-like [Triplophysa rosa]|uniref:Proline-rich protein 24-like n=1 Tax=Triplophysa rosa TaxID=992332 RepID=A0A9W7TRY7_TRIRA|nr:putative proline-rich protein 24-like [Triplophysa rosa]
MRENKPVSTVRTNEGTERITSYPGDQRVKQASRGTKIWIKVAMGIAYFLCVSIAAFFLAIYYVLFWTPDASSHNSTRTSNRSCLQG